LAVLETQTTKQKGIVSTGKTSPTYNEQKCETTSISAKVDITSLNSHFPHQKAQHKMSGRKKAEPETPHFLSFNQDIVVWSQKQKCGLKYVIPRHGLAQRLAMERSEIKVRCSDWLAANSFKRHFILF
jgi:hypothetical protein